MESKSNYIWIEDEEYSYLPAKIINEDNTNYELSINIDGKIISKKVPKNQNYTEVHPSCLRDLDQQALLHNTRVRFNKEEIYTFIGMPILIAMNPYKSLDIYNDTKIKFYKDFFHKLKTNPYGVNNPIPHLYHIAEAAYQDMINEKKSQSIVISGESGSGKTQSTKIILKYLAVSSLHSFDSIKNVQKEEEVSVEKQVLDSNPLLEAFGNAKTVKNNNSSRFGKFIQLNFTENGKIISARIFNYLLEKSRVVNISPEERNYHIFYQLIRGADEREKKKYNIKDLKYFNYLKFGCFDVEDTDDALNFLETKDCMMKLKFKPEEISYIFTVIMGILYLGNVDLIEGEEDKMNNIPILIHPDTQSDFNKAAEMLGIDQNVFLEILTIRKFKDISTGKYINRKMSLEKSYHSRDSIAKIVYSKVFDYILKKINFAISNPEEMKNRKNLLKIGLLDIFGFENFQVNSFEQLCINYANERLQQFFNNHIFKLEQEEYSKEGIDFNQVEFKDNKDIINLIDDPKNSIFSFLDSEALLANGSDENFEKKVYKNLSSHESLTEKVEEYIGIEHYAGEVYYYTEGFMVKNIDQLSQDIYEALEKSKNKLIKKIFEKKSDTKSSKKITNTAKLQSDSISKQFKSQLDDLMKMLVQSNPRYIKCIKPNSQKKPIHIESLDVMDQLLSAGVLEAIKIRKQGYSIRRSNEEFSKRYLKLFPDIGNKMKIYEEKNNFEEPAKLMFDFFANLDDMKEYFNPQKKLIQLGYTKIFMKEEVKDVLEYKLNKIKYIQMIQNNVRSFDIRKNVKKKLRAIRKMQALFRGFMARIYVNSLRLCVKIQKSYRRFIQRKNIYFNLKNLADENIKRKEREREKEKEKELKLQREKEKEKNIKQKEPEKNPQEKELKNLKSSKEKESKIEAEIEIDIELEKDKETEINNNTSSQINNRKKSIKKKLNPNQENSNSNSEAFLIEDTANKKRNKNLKNKSKLNDLFSYNIENVLETEMKISLKNLKEELVICKTENDKLTTELNQKNSEIRKKEIEIERLKSNNTSNLYKQHLESLENMGLTDKANFLTEQERSKYQDELRKIKIELYEKEGQIDVNDLRIEELSKTNKNLNKTIDELNDQMLKKREKINTEMEKLAKQTSELETKKTEFGMQLVKLANKFGKNLNIEEAFNNMNLNLSNFSTNETSLLLGNNSNLTNEQVRKSILGKNPNSTNKFLEENSDTKKIISNLKNENKNLIRKIEDLKSKYDREIINLKTEMEYKDMSLKDCENSIKKKENFIKKLNEEKFSFENEIEFNKSKLENFSSNEKEEFVKIKKDFDLILRKKNLEISDLKETMDTLHLSLDKSKRMENVLRGEIKNRENDLDNLKEKLNEKLGENDLLTDENLNFKKENFDMKSSLTLGEVEFRSKFDLDSKLKNQEIKILKDNLQKFQKYLEEMQDKLDRKKKVLTKTKQMNVILCDLARIKKGEIQCLETLQYNESDSVKNSLIEIRKSEKTLLTKLAEISAYPDCTDSELEDSEDDDIDDYSN